MQSCANASAVAHVCLPLYLVILNSHRRGGLHHQEHVAWKTGKQEGSQASLMSTTGFAHSDHKNFCNVWHDVLLVLEHPITLVGPNLAIIELVTGLTYDGDH